MEKKITNEEFKVRMLRTIVKRLAELTKEYNKLPSYATTAHIIRKRQWIEGTIKTNNEWLTALTTGKWAKVGEK